MTLQLPAVGTHRAHGEGAPCETFHCTVEHIGDGISMAPCGDLDVAALPHLAGPLCLIGPDVSLVHLDLSAVTFMDSSGLSFLTRLQSRCTRAKARLEVSGLRPQHRQFLQLARFTLLVPASA